jgi:hypothetical protein
MRKVIFLTNHQRREIQKTTEKSNMIIVCVLHCLLYHTYSVRKFLTNSVAIANQILTY